MTPFPPQVLPLEAGGAALSTSDVVERLVKPHTAQRRCRYVELSSAQGSLWPGPASGHEMRFVSHGWKNPFSLLWRALAAHFKAAGAVPERTFIWLDIFAIKCDSRAAKTQPQPA